ncbi:MAG: hypothetical protein R3F59_12495 [Myxococcota bacterium]
MRVGTMFLGEVERLGVESVQTKFFILGVPVVPLESFYATGLTANGLQGFPIPLHASSVAAGYLRLGAGIVAFTLGLFAFLEWRDWSPQYGLATGAAVATAVWAASTFGLGRLGHAERLRRSRLQEAVGLGAPPELLPETLRSDLATALEAKWAALSPDTDWRDRLQSGDAAPDELLLLHALAEYAGERDLAQFAAVGLAA